MYCSNCGKEIPNGSKFCLYCGEKVPVIEENSNDVEKEVSNEKEDSDVIDIEEEPCFEYKIVRTFKLFNRELEIETSVDNSAYLKRLLKTYSKEASKKLEEKYYSLGSMMEVANHLPSMGLSILDEYIDKCVALLVENGIYTVDKNIYKSEYCDHLGEAWGYVCNDALHDYMQIVEDLASTMEKHSNMADSRPQFQSFGFGVEGALKGMVTSTALNFASDFIADVISTGADARSSNKAINEIEELYHQYRTLEKFEMGIEKIILDMYYSLTYAFAKNGIHEFVAGARDNNNDPVLNNIDYIEDKEKVLFDLIKQNKFALSVLNYAYENDIGNKDEIVTYAHYIGADIKPVKIISNTEFLLMEMDYTDIKAIQEMKKVIEISQKRYHIEINHYMDFLNSKEELARKQLLVVDNEQYETIEDGYNARQTLLELIEDVSDINEDERDEIKECIERFSNSNIKTKQKYIDYLNEKLSQANKRAKTVFGVELESEESANEARKYCKELKEKILNLRCDDINDLINLKKDIELNLDGRLSGNYIKRLDCLINLYKNSIDFKDKYNNYNFENRLEYTKVIIEGEKIYHLLDEFNLSNKDFINLYEILKRNYLIVYGEEYSSIDVAIQKYIDLINNANSYKKYLENKMSNKNQGFFGSLKVGLSAVVNGRYENDFLRVTKNKTENVPMDTIEQLNEMDSLIGQANKMIEMVKNQIESIVINDPDEKVEMLSIKDIYIECYPVSHDEKLQQVKKVVTGNILEISFANEFTKPIMKEMLNNLYDINKYYFIEDSISEMVATRMREEKRIYIITYRRLTEIEPYVTAISNLGFKVRLI